MCSGINQVLAGPKVIGKRCCYTVCRGPAAPCGRPFLDDRVASLTERGDWTSTGLPSSPSNAALRDAWLADAAAEHASVASFARFALELLSVGAPAELVHDAHVAALDEIEHARLCFALAARYAEGASYGPAPLSLDGMVPRTTLAEIAAAAAEEACCAETFAALAAASARSECTDAAVQPVLDRIAKDEARHAELGWRFVAWALAVDNDERADVRDAVTSAFERGMAKLASITVVRDGEDAAWRAAGRLTPGELARVAHEARTDVIEPCLRELLRLHS